MANKDSASSRKPALSPGIAPPERIESAGLVLRRWAPEDFQARFEAVRDSFDHLHPWMPWAAEPPTLESQREHAESQYGSWPSEGNCNYGIFDPSSGDVLGALGLHDRIGPGALDIGYFCHVRHTGKGVITRAAAAATRAALELEGIDRVMIRCDEANAPSAAVPRRLGYRLDRIEDSKITAPAETGRRMVWIMVRGEFFDSPADVLSR